MGALSRPEVPDGPVRTLSEALHALHHRAGWPSLRDLAKDIAVSRTTVFAAFSEPRVPRWGLLELLVEALGGDTQVFHALWLAATESSPTDQASPVLEPTSDAVRQVPGDVAAFTGRAEALTELDRRLAPADSVPICVVAGTAGVGKTAIAVRWAHRAAHRFPDGQLYTDLRGYDPGVPVEPAEALAGFLVALGVPNSAIPATTSDRAARYRSLLAGRQMLVLLDNAHSVEQVRDLLPGAASCAVLITSRDALPGLVARYGATRLDLPLLSAQEAVALLRSLIGSRVDDEPDDAAALAQRCACLPLALRVAAEFAATRLRDSLADLVAELDAEPRRLDLLAAGDDDEYSAVRAVFSWSYNHLRPDAARMFRALGVHPGLDFDAPAAAAIVDSDVPAARRLLEALARNHLVQRGMARRYNLHDLLRAYAADLVADDGELADFRRRLYDHYLTLARAAVDAAFPTNSQPIALPTVPPEPIQSEATTWLDTERPTLLAVAAESGAHAIALSHTLAAFLDTRAHYSDAVALHTCARMVAVQRGDRDNEANALNLLGTIRRRLGQYVEALADHEKSRTIHAGLGDRPGEAAALHNMGVIRWRLGRYAQARDDLLQALAIHRETHNRSGEGGALYSLGIVLRRLGDYPQALQLHHQALEVLEEIGDRAGAGRALNNASVVFLRLGRLDEALAYLDRALAIQRERQDKAGVAVALTNVGLVLERQGRFTEALENLEAALLQGEQIGYRVGQADALRGIGVVYSRLGRHHEALDHLQRALSLGQEIGEADVQTGAHNELGEALTVAGQPDNAAPQHELALALATESGDRFEEARALLGLARVADDADSAQRRSTARNLLAGLGLSEAAMQELERRRTGIEPA